LKESNIPSFVLRIIHHSMNMEIILNEIKWAIDGKENLWSFM
jgi:hypothetical protein